MNRGELVDGAHAAIERGSKSFRAASRLFEPAIRERTWLLYCWCRHCDDVCDGQTDGFAPGPSGSVAMLREQTRRAIEGQPVEELPFRALAQLRLECRLPARLLEDHLAGFELDERGWRPQTDADLELYCYHVAGAVGCMMAIIMGVDPDDRDTLKRASDLGIAFQMSNIARDLREDQKAGRCYVPARWLEELGVDSETLFAQGNEAARAAIAGRLLERIRSHEASARRGVGNLGFRSRLAVLAALRIYGSIGRRVTALGPNAWDRRVTIGRTEKLALLIPSFVEALFAGRRQ